MGDDGHDSAKNDETATLSYPGGTAEFPLLPAVDGASSMDISAFTKKTGYTTLFRS